MPLYNRAIQFIKSVLTGDDKGLIIEEQLSVGTPANPKEAVFGAGDSYGVGLEDRTAGDDPVLGSAWHCTDANITAQTITSATDVTEILASDSGSTVGLFNGTAVGNNILLGSDYKFQGVKAKINTAGDVDAGHIHIEYLANTTDTWIDSKMMVTDANYPHASNANVMSMLPSKSEQWRLGFDPEGNDIPWEKVTLNINGTDYTKYWARAHIVTTITTDPIVEQLKLHTSRFEINATGVTEMFGFARYQRTLAFGLESTFPNSLNDPANESVAYGSAFSAKYVDNEFANNATDGFGISQLITAGLDTSIPLVFAVSYYVKGTATGDVNLHADVFTIKDGFVYDGTATPTAYNVTDTIATDSNLIRRSVTMQLDVSDLRPNDGILISLHRDATVGNTLDTVAANIVITNVVLTGHFWRV